MTPKYTISEDLRKRMLRYNAAKRAGTNNSIRHQQVYIQVQAEIGPVAAEYFDREGELPPVDGQFTPWPMSPTAHGTLNTVRVGVAGIGGCAGLLAASRLASSMPVGMIVTVVAAVLAVVLLQVVLSLAKPRNLKQRREASERYASMLEEHDAQEEARAAQGIAERRNASSA